MKHLKKSILTLAIAATLMLQNAQAGDPDICQIQGATMGSVAQERDKGASKAQVKRIFRKQFGKKYQGFDNLVDIVYDELKDMSPKQVAATVEYVCLRT